MTNKNEMIKYLNSEEDAKFRIGTVSQLISLKEEIINKMDITLENKTYLSMAVAVDTFCIEMMFQAGEIEKMNYGEFCDLLINHLKVRLKRTEEAFNLRQQLFQKNQEKTDVH